MQAFVSHAIPTSVFKVNTSSGHLSVEVDAMHLDVWQNSPEGYAPATIAMLLRTSHGMCNPQMFLR